MEKDCIIQHFGTIEITGDAVVIDPCYGTSSLFGNGLKLDKKKDIAPGIYDCYVGWVDEGPYGARIAFMEIAKDGYHFAIPGDECVGSVSVDSGTMSIGGQDEWKKHHGELTAEDEWYKENVVKRSDEDAYVLDGGNTFISSTGYGDGMYDVFGDADYEDNRFYRIMVEFIPLEEDEFDEGYNFLDFIPEDEKVDFSLYN